MNHKPIVGGRYQLIEKLGTNDWKVFYLAQDTTMPGDFRCVVQQFRLDEKENGKISPKKIRVRYENEAYLWQRLEAQDLLPPILACFEESESLYLVRELITGQSLAERLKQSRKLGQTEVEQLLKDILDRLELIHQAGFVHSNLKPSNLIYSDRHKCWYLIDLSLAESMTKESGKEDRAITVFYSRNEYYPVNQPIAKIIPERDLYALGAIASESLTGKTKERIPDNLSVDKFLSKECSRCDPLLLEIIARLMNFDAADGYHEASEVLADLNRVREKRDATVVPATAAVNTERNSQNGSANISLNKSVKTAIQAESEEPETQTQNAVIPAAKSRRSLLRWGAIGGVLAVVGLGIVEYFNPQLRPRYQCDLGQNMLVDNPKAALKNFQQATNLNQNSVCGWLGKAQAFYELERYPAAVAAYDRVDRLKPDLIATWQGRGEVLYRLERFEAATTAYNKTLRMQPDNSVVWNRKGKALYKLELFEEALAAQDKAIALDPDNVQALADRGTALIGLGKYQEALEAFNQAQEVDPLDPQLWQSKALVLQYLNRPQESIRLYQEALEAYESVIANNPQNITALLDKANVLSKLQRHEEALNVYEQAVFLNENSHLTWLGKGNALFALRRYEEALAAFDRAVKVQPKSYLSWHNRGSLLRDGLRNLPEAIASYDRSLQINPNFYHGWRDRGIALSQSQQHQAAIDSFKKALKIEPNDYQAWAGRGIALSSLGKTDEAISVLDRAIEIQPQDPFVWMNRAVVLETAGNYGEACNSYQQVKKIRPGFSPAIQKLKQLRCQ